jgi:hypothetical protein
MHGVHAPPPNQWGVFGSPEEFAMLPVVHREQILFLDYSSTEAVYDAFNRRDLLCGGDGFGNRPFSGGFFKYVEELHIFQKTDLKKWLYHRGVPFATTVFLLPAFGNMPAILTTWKIVAKYALQIFSRDNVVVVGENVEWCLHYHHSDVITFAHDPVIAKMRW